jgi:hypothetical protein
VTTVTAGAKLLQRPGPDQRTAAHGTVHGARERDRSQRSWVSKKQTLKFYEDLMDLANDCYGKQFHDVSWHFRL